MKVCTSKGMNDLIFFVDERFFWSFGACVCTGRSASLGAVVETRRTEARGKRSRLGRQKGRATDMGNSASRTLRHRQLGSNMQGRRVPTPMTTDCRYKSGYWTARKNRTTRSLM